MKLQKLELESPKFFKTRLSYNAGKKKKEEAEFLF
jgi:hypothetical protein